LPNSAVSHRPPLATKCSNWPQSGLKKKPALSPRSSQRGSSHLKLGRKPGKTASTQSPMKRVWFRLRHSGASTASGRRGIGGSPAEEFDRVTLECQAPWPRGFFYLRGGKVAQIGVSQRNPKAQAGPLRVTRKGSPRANVFSFRRERTFDAAYHPMPAWSAVPLAGRRSRSW